MGVRQRLYAFAFARPAVFVAPVPGAPDIRLATLDAVRERRWPLATTPADADLLVICGEPHDELAAAIDRAWAQIPEPRARVTITATSDVPSDLTHAQATLHAAPGPGPGGRNADEADGHGAGGDGSGGEHGDHMGVVAGLPMADRGPDRDGLRLDVLHVPFGPLLADWPPGLVLDMAVQGDVVQAASARIAGRSYVPTVPDEPRVRAVAHLDGLGSLLALAGFGAPARQCHRIRDDLYAGRAAAAFPPLARRIRRSRTLRWMLRGVGVITPDRAGLPAVVYGDAYDRLVRSLAAVESALGGGPPPPAQPAQAVLDALPGVVDGMELAAVRLLVAGLIPVLSDVTAVTHA